MVDYSLLNAITNTEGVYEKDSIPGIMYEEARRDLFDFISGEDLMMEFSDPNVDSMKVYVKMRKDFIASDMKAKKALVKKDYDTAMQECAHCREILSEAKAKINQIHEATDHNAAIVGSLLGFIYNRAEAWTMGQILSKFIGKLLHYDNKANARYISLARAAYTDTKSVIANCQDIYASKKKDEKVTASNFNLMKGRLISNINAFGREVKKTEKLIQDTKVLDAKRAEKKAINRELAEKRASMKATKRAIKKAEKELGQKADKKSMRFIKNKSE